MELNPGISRAQLSSMCLLLVCCLSGTILGCSASPHHVDLSWSAPASSPAPIVGYNVYRLADGDSSYHRLNSSPVKETRYTDHLVQGGRTYQYLVRSVDSRGIESSPTATVNVFIPR